jgi:FkbM family methyltransferase
MPAPPRSFKSTLCRWPRLYRFAKRAKGYAAYRLGIPHDNDFAFFANLAGGLFVDVGANAGQSARSLRIFNRELAILSFEPNRLLEPELRATRRLLGAGYDYRLIGLGNRDEWLTLYVPFAGRTPLSPWATLDRASLETNRRAIEREAGGAFTVGEVPVEVRRFDELGLRPLAVKIDVEGGELAVLEGMRETLARDEPILMLENNSSAEAAAALVASLGYRTFEYEVDAKVLRETDDLCGTINYFACTSAVLEWLRESDDLRIVLREPLAV